MVAEQTKSREDRIAAFAEIRIKEDFQDGQWKAGRRRYSGDARSCEMDSEISRTMYDVQSTC